MKVTNNQKTTEYRIQDTQYLFPYHYIPHFENGIARIFRTYHNAYEYLCYTRHVEDTIRYLEPKSILEVGCGDGKIIGQLDDISKRVAVDLSTKAIEFAKIFNKDVEFHVKDASELIEKFDVVFAVEVLEHIPDEHLSSFIKTLAERTLDNGYVIISVPTVVKPLIAKHYRHYDLRLFQKQLKASNASLNIKNVEYVYYENWLLKLYKRFSHNKYWFFQSKYLEKIVWDYVWKKLRLGTASNGTHMIVTMQKVTAIK